MSKSISNGLSVDIPVQATHSLKLAWLGGTYTAQIISGAANVPVALATNSASDQTFGPYATAIMVRLTVSAIGRVAWDTASAPAFIPPGEQFTRQDDGIPVTLSGVGPAAAFAVDGAGNSGIRNDGIRNDGTPLFSWSGSGGTTVTTANGGTNTATGAVFNLETGFATLPYNASRARVNAAFTGTHDWSTFKGLGIYVTAQVAAPRIIRVFVTSTGSALTNYAYWDLAVVNGTNLYFLQQAQARISGAFAWATEGAAVNYVRIADQNSNDEAGSTLTGLIAGESIVIGAARANPRGRAMYLPTFDDAYINTIQSGSNFPTGYPNSGASHSEILSYYGLKGTMYVHPNDIGTNGRMNLAQLRRLRDIGWTIGSTGQVALTTFGTAAEVTAEVQNTIAEMVALGFPDAGHYALNLGSSSYNVHDGLAAVVGLKTVIGIGGASGTTRTALGFPWGRIAGYAGTTLIRDPGNAVFLKSRQQLDSGGGLTTTDHQNYIDQIVATAAIGASYAHSITVATATELDYIASYAKTKQAAGLLDVLTVAEAYAKFPARP